MSKSHATPKRPPREALRRDRMPSGTFRRYDDTSLRALTLLPGKVRALRKRRAKNKRARASRKANR